jgi:hypothetical protein
MEAFEKIAYGLAVGGVVMDHRVVGADESIVVAPDSIPSRARSGKE